MISWEAEVEIACGALREMLGMLRDNGTQRAAGMITFHNAPHGHIAVSIDATAEGLKDACIEMVEKAHAGEVHSTTVQSVQSPPNVEDN